MPVLGDKVMNVALFEAGGMVGSVFCGNAYEIRMSGRSSRLSATRLGNSTRNRATGRARELERALRGIIGSGRCGAI